MLGGGALILVAATAALSLPSAKTHQASSVTTPSPVATVTLPTDTAQSAIQPAPQPVIAPSSVAATPTVVTPTIAASATAAPATAAPTATAMTAPTGPAAAPATMPDHDQDFFSVPPTAAADSQMQPAAPSDRLDMVLRVDKGDTLVKILTDVGVPTADASGAVHAMAAVFNPRRLQIGQTLTVTVQPGTSSGDSAQLLQIAMRPEAERDVTVKRNDDGDFSADEVKYPVTAVRVRYAGRIDDSLFADGVAAGVPVPVLNGVIHAFSYDVDFQRDIHPGDSFEVVCERLYTSDGRPARDGRVLYAELVLHGKKLAFYRYKPGNGDEDYYGLDGQSIVKALLRTPIDGARITSGFGMRGHPILGFTRMHTGVDFGAPPGTPIYAAGNGTVEFVGPRGGYGNFVMIRHNATYETAYGHMTGFAKGMAAGVRVHQGQVIGFVGMTGLATGPHLHYEVRKPINPVEFSMPVGPKLVGRELQKFHDYVAAFDRNRQNMQLGPPTTRLLVDAGKKQ
jgi:murein DD-endopeptidase MepM/ murein hydrolase activator NlpD